MALLEAQCWRNEMRSLGRQVAKDPPSEAFLGGNDRPVEVVDPAGKLAHESARILQVQCGPTAISHQASGGSRWAAVGMSRARCGLAMAAGLLLAFALGIGARDVLSRHAPGSDRAAGRSKTSVAVNPAPHHANTSSRGLPQQSTDPGQVVAVADSTGPADVALPVAGDTITFLIQTGQGSTTQRVQVPLVSAKAITEEGMALRWPEANEPPLPDRVMRQFEQRGHQVHWQRRYAPLQLDDGRQVVFPVDDFEIAPAVFRPL